MLSDHQLHGAETLPKTSIGWVGCTNVTDRRQTDDRQTTDDRRQTTDGRTTTYSEHEHEFTFAKNRYIFSTTLWFNPPTEGFPWDDFRKISPGCRQVTNVLSGAEKLPKISIGWVGCTNVTDRRQTTDGRTTTYSEREHEFTFAKNGTM